MGLGELCVRLERIKAHIRVHRERIAFKRGARCQIGLRITLRRTADIAALGIHQHDQPGCPRGFRRRLQRRHAFRSMPLEQADLRLHYGDLASRRLNYRLRPFPDALGGIPAKHLGDHARMRVDPHAERAEFPCALDEPGCKISHAPTSHITLTTCKRRRAVSEAAP